jgi:hypothetical protein
MKTTIFFLLSTILSFTYSQTVYDVTPGTKGNQIILSLANISDIKNASDVTVKVSKPSVNLIFSKNEEIIKNIDVGKETDVAFMFDIKREVKVNSKDTVGFLITDNKSIFIKKEFVLSFTPPKEYRLEQNYPNPFNPVTTILYQLPDDSKVTLKVYDILGSEVAELVNDVQTAGYKEVKFGGSKYSSGVYIYRLSSESGSGNFTSIKKMVMLK